MSVSQEKVIKVIRDTLVQLEVALAHFSAPENTVQVSTAQPAAKAKQSKPYRACKPATTESSSLG